MNTSDTPRTDAECELRGNHDVETSMADFVRQLERELAVAKSHIAWMESFDGWMQHPYTKVQTDSIKNDYVAARRPLQPIKKIVPLGPRDIPAGSVFGSADWGDEIWCAPLSVEDRCVHFKDDHITYENLKEHKWLIKRPGEDWMPCSKEV